MREVEVTIYALRTLATSASFSLFRPFAAGNIFFRGPPNYAATWCGGGIHFWPFIQRGEFVCCVSGHNTARYYSAAKNTIGKKSLLVACFFFTGIRERREVLNNPPPFSRLLKFFWVKTWGSSSNNRHDAIFHRKSCLICILQKNREIFFRKLCFQHFSSKAVCLLKKGNKSTHAVFLFLLRL